MAVTIAVGVSESFDPVEAFRGGRRRGGEGLDAVRPVPAVRRRSAPPARKWILSAVHDELEPRQPDRVRRRRRGRRGREIEEGPGAVVWAASMPDAEISTHHFRVEPVGATTQVELPPDPTSSARLPDRARRSVHVLDRGAARPPRRGRPDLPVLGGLASAAVGGGGTLFRDGDVLAEGAVACSLSGVPVLPCVSQGRRRSAPR